MVRGGGECFMIRGDSDLTIPDPGDIGTMAHTETQTGTQCYDVSTARSWEEHRAWETSNERGWEKKLRDGKNMMFYFIL